MKSNKETTKIKSNSSISTRKLSKNKKQNPKHKPISKTQTDAKNQRKKKQNQVEMSSKLKTHTWDLKDLSRKYATMEIWDENTECLGGR